MCRASGVAAELDFSAVPAIEGAKEALADGFIPGGSRRNLDWVRPHLSVESETISEEDLIFLADAQTSGGLLVIGEVPGYPVIGRTVERGVEPTGEGNGGSGTGENTAYISVR